MRPRPKKQSKQTNNKSAIIDHAGRENHVIDWEGTRLVATCRESQDSARRIRKAISIKRTPNNRNRDGGAYQLSDIYDAVIAKTSSSGDWKISGLLQSANQRPRKMAEL